MTLDHEEQRKVLLAALNGMQWPGQVVEVIAVVKRQVTEAKVVGGEDGVIGGE